MRRIINTNIRFDLKREDDRQAYEFLRRMDRKQFKSYTRAVVAALNDFFSRREKRQADPYLETREKEDRFLRQVLDTVSEGIRQSMSRVQDTALIQPILPVAEPTEKQETSSADSENYEMAEAFLKEMGM
ncbi:MAG: hypothetical protein IKP72_02180 [Clostridia bacterium]|nr:hypothetical protein [Clostridia bacterium]